ncbi:uncharacterized protein LOC112564186 isoform X1 [Pomacea canaliculata]|uniref:uncharacterized protein LOC112564186 isoform X1 n=1 Tax=Pomacea canaliculata TaxID=400727 RepID=UPI000D728C45|nr:uncharacterized protein LOC112564186 isoform X1 [Pomacea canaliculata]
MKKFLLVETKCVLSVLRLTNGQSCVSSSQCAANQCCRDPATNRVLVEDPQGFLEIVQPGSSGHCVAGGAQPGDMCDSTCSCPAVCPFGSPADQRPVLRVFKPMCGQPVLQRPCYQQSVGGESPGISEDRPARIVWPLCGGRGPARGNVRLHLQLSGRLRVLQ